MGQEAENAQIEDHRLETVAKPLPKEDAEGFIDEGFELLHHRSAGVAAKTGKQPFCPPT
ncbi:MAG: hypothetical protein H6559_16085 [Lewinellaceae bacterium]|nr:hypothetical protein [Lewinellaceae bacterium]